MAAGGGERAARLRAIRGYGGLDQKAMAPHLNVSLTTLSRMENGKSQVSDEDLETAARVCGVPLTFAQSGFARLTRPVTDVERRLYEVEDAVRRLEEHVGGVGAAAITDAAAETVKALEDAAETPAADDPVPPGTPAQAPAPSERPGDRAPRAATRRVARRNARK